MDGQCKLEKKHIMKNDLNGHCKSQKRKKGTETKRCLHTFGVLKVMDEKR
jgi:hypothetical protein